MLLLLLVLLLLLLVLPLLLLLSILTAAAVGITNVNGVVAISVVGVTTDTILSVLHCFCNSCFSCGIGIFHSCSYAIATLAHLTISIDSCFDTSDCLLFYSFESFWTSSTADVLQEVEGEDMLQIWSIEFVCRFIYDNVDFICFVRCFGLTSQICVHLMCQYHLLRIG